MHDANGPLDDLALEALAADVEASARGLAGAAFGALVRDLVEPLTSVSVRAWPDDFPTDIATLRRAPFESRADSVMYRRVIAEVAEATGVAVHVFDARTIERSAADQLGGDELLARQRQLLGPPWNKDHRVAFAATIVASASHA